MVEGGFWRNLELLKVNGKYVAIYKGSPYCYLISGKLYDAIKEEYIDGDILSEYQFLKRIGALPKPVGRREVDVKSFILILNTTCNLACSYCFASGGNYGKKKTHMRREVAFKALDFIAKIEPACPSLVFYGGEPLLSFGLLKEVVEYMLEKVPRCGFTLITNGTLINEEIASFLKRYKFDVQVSLDGPKEIHDKYRRYPDGRGSYDDVRMGIELLRDKSVRFRIRATINNIDIDPIRIKEFLSRFSPHHISIRYNTSFYREPYICELILENLRERVKKYQTDLELFDKVPELAPILFQVLFGRYSSGCIAGREMLLIDPYGDIYPCDIGVLSGEKLRIGNVFDFDIHEKLTQFKKWFLDVEECRDCWALGLCGGGCHIVRKFNKRRFEERCLFAKENIQSAIGLLINLNLEQILKAMKGTGFSGEKLRKLTRSWQLRQRLWGWLRHLKPLFLV